MANINKTTLDNWVPEIWSKSTLDAVEFGTMIAKRVCREFEGEVKQMGDTVHIMHTSNYTANDKVAGTNISFEAMTHGKTSLTIDAHKVAAYQVEHFAEVQAMPGYREKQTKKLGYALARDLDVAVASMFASFSASEGALGSIPGDNEYLACWERLAKAGAIVEATADDDLSIFIAPKSYAGALKLDKFVHRDYGREGDAVSKANVGQIYESKVYMSNLLTVNGAGVDGAFMHRDVIGLAVQEAPRMETDFIIEADAQAVAAHQIYGKVELVRPVETAGSVSTTDNFGVWLKSA